MVRALALLALSATGALALNVRAPDLTSFEMGCYHKVGLAGESGGNGGRGYRGLVAATHSGRTCKKWSDSPKAGSVSDDVFNEDGTIEWGNGLGNHNYCRNPDNSNSKPWCYTVDPNVAKGKEECEFSDEARTLGTRVASGLDCKCAAQLYGSTTTTKDTSEELVLTQVWGTNRKGERCQCK